MLRASRWLFGVAAIVYCGFAHAAFDDVAECPGGNSARDDIVNCFPFDNRPAECTTGRERACFTANGYPPVGTMSATYSVRFGGAAVGTGYVEEKPIPGSTGASIATTIAEGRRTREFSLRYYKRWGPGFQDYTIGNNHTLFIGNTRSGAGCGTSMQIDGDQRQFIAIATGCSNPVRRVWDDDLKNGRWYLFEYYGKMETSCSNPAASNGCNGYLAIYRDGVKLFEATDWNWAAGDQTAQFMNVLVPRTYYQGGFQRWQATTHWDNIVIGNDADRRIGAAERENARGTENRNVYYTSSGLDPFIVSSGAPNTSLRPGPDCSGLGTAIGFGRGFDSAYFSIDRTRSAANEWLAANVCSYRTGDVVDGSLLMQLPADASRAGFMNAPAGDSINRPLAAVGRDSMTGGYLFLHEGNNYTGNPILAGLASSGPTCRGQLCQWIGLTVNDGKWALGSVYTTQSEVTEVVATSTAVAATGVWHSFEIALFKSGTADVWIDGVRRIVGARLPVAPGGATNMGFVGVSHRPGTGQAFKVNFDDIYWSTVSREVCYGDWEADCPSAALGSVRRVGDIVRPLPPSELR